MFEYMANIAIPSDLPLPDGYDKITIFGEQYVDYLWITNRTAINTEINNSKTYNFRPEWEPDTVFLANFDNDLKAGSITSLNEDIVSWSIYKKKINEISLTFVANIPAVNNNIIDYAVANQTEYQYYLFPITENTVGAPLISDAIKTDWWNWSLTDIYKSNIDNVYYVNTNNIWIFDMNLDSGSITQVLDKQLYDGFTQFPKTSSGNRNYLTGSISCLIGKIENSNYIDTVERQQNFASFINNGNQKLLKDRKGNVFIVDIMSNSFEIMDELMEQVVSISFTWTQIGNIDGISIIEEVV